MDGKIRCYLICFFSRGILENRIEKLQGNVENLADKYQVLQIFDKSILQRMEIVDSYIGVIQIKEFVERNI